MFLQVDPLKGESKDASHKDWSDVYAFSWGVSRSGNSYGLSGKVNVQNLSLTKVLDKSTTGLLKAAFTGKPFGSVHLEVRRAGTTSPVLTMNLADVLVSSVQTGGYGGEDRLIENLSFNFASSELIVPSPPVSGKPVESTSASWNYATGAPVVNAAPTLVIGASGQTTAENIPSDVPFTVGDDSTALNALMVSASSSNLALVPLTGLVLSGTGASRYLTLTPLPNASGESTISLIVQDGLGLSAIQNFKFTVTPVNNGPVVAPVSAQALNLGQSLAIPVTLSDVDSELNSLTLTATSGNSGVLPSEAIVISGTGASRLLTVTPTGFGQSVITLQAGDGLATSAPVLFLLSVNRVAAGVPTNITLSSQTIPENSAPGTVIGILTAVDADTPTGHTFVLLDDAGGRFKLSATQPTSLLVGKGRLLDFETAPNPVITVRATDTSGNVFTRQLTIALSNVNDGPLISIGSLDDRIPGTPLPLAAISIADADAGNAAVQTTFSVLSGSLTLAGTGALAGKVTGSGSATVVVAAPLADLNAALAAGQLIYSAADTFLGNDLLKVVCSDLGHTGPGGAKTDTSMAAILVYNDLYGMWKKSQFTSPQLADAAISGDATDLDGDTLTNLLEYALGSEPDDRTNGLTNLIPTTVEVAGVRYPAFAYTRRTNDPLLVLTLEVATDARNWVSGADVTTVVSTEALSASSERVFARSLFPLATYPNQQMRLRVTRLVSAP